MHTSVTNCTLRKNVQSSRNLVYILCFHLSLIILLSIKRLVGLLIRRQKKAFHLQSFWSLNFLGGLTACTVDTAQTFTSWLSWKSTANTIMNLARVSTWEVGEVDSNLLRSSSRKRWRNMPVTGTSVKTNATTAIKRHPAPLQCCALSPGAVTSLHRGPQPCGMLSSGDAL